MRYSNYYFIGIGGIGMSAIARYCKFKGASVSGYDRTASDLTRALEAEGIAVHYEDDPARIPGTPADTLVVFTPAVPAGLGELCQARERGPPPSSPTSSPRAAPAAPPSWAAPPRTTAPTC